MTLNRQKEPLLEQDNTRFTQLPIRYPTLQQAYKEHESMFWTAEEIDYQADVDDFEKLTKDEKMLALTTGRNEEYTKIEKDVISRVQQAFVEARQQE